MIDFNTENGQMILENYTQYIVSDASAGMTFSICIIFVAIGLIVYLAIAKPFYDTELTVIATVVCIFVLLFGLGFYFHNSAKKNNAKEYAVKQIILDTKTKVCCSK